MASKIQDKKAPRRTRKTARPTLIESQLSAGELRMLQAFRQCSDEVQDMVTRTMERSAKRIETMRRKVSRPALSLIAGGQQ